MYNVWFIRNLNFDWLTTSESHSNSIFYQIKEVLNSELYSIFLKVNANINNHQNVFLKHKISKRQIDREITIIILDMIVSFQLVFKITEWQSGPNSLTPVSLACQPRDQMFEPCKGTLFQHELTRVVLFSCRKLVIISEHSGNLHQ